MKKFAEYYQDFQIVQTVFAQLTWYHNTTLMEKVDSLETRLFYATQAIQNGWSRNVLVHQIESGLFERQGKAVNNFEHNEPFQKTYLNLPNGKSSVFFLLHRLLPLPLGLGLI